MNKKIKNIERALKSAHQGRCHEPLGDCFVHDVMKRIRVERAQSSMAEETEGFWDRVLMPFAMASGAVAVVLAVVAVSLVSGMQTDLLSQALGGEETMYVLRVVGF